MSIDTDIEKQLREYLASERKGDRHHELMTNIQRIELTLQFHEEKDNARHSEITSRLVELETETTNTGEHYVADLELKLREMEADKEEAEKSQLRRLRESRRPSPFSPTVVKVTGAVIIALLSAITSHMVTRVSTSPSIPTVSGRTP